MNARDRHYADMADKEEGRDHRVEVKYAGRVTPADMATGRAWLKFNPGKEIVWITDADGTPKWLTRVQVAVLHELTAMSDGNIRATMTAVAAKLGVSISTVSRAVVKLQAFGILAVVVVRGKFGGMTVLRRVKDDGLDRFRRVARERVRRWYLAAQRRLSRLESNLAPYGPRRVTGTSTPTSTYRAQDWTPEELREAGII